MAMIVTMRDAVAEVFDEEFNARVGYNNLFGDCLADCIDWDEVSENQPMARIPDAYRDAIVEVLDGCNIFDTFGLHGIASYPYGGGAYYDIEQWAQEFPRLEQYESHLDGLLSCEFDEAGANVAAIELTLEGELIAALQEMLGDWPSIREALINEMLATI